MNVCKEPTCGMQIQFGITAKGKRMPIDMAASDDGTIVWEDGTHVHVLTADEKLVDRRPRFTSHFVTCPARNDFRRKRDRR